MRLYHVMKSLAARHELTLLTLLENAEDREFLKPLAPLCRQLQAFEAPSLAIPATLRQRLQAPFYRLAYSPAMAAAIRQALAEQKFDLIHVDTTRMAVYTPLLTGQRKLMSATDAITLHFQSRLPHLTDRLRKLRGRDTLWTVEQFIRGDPDAILLVLDSTNLSRHLTLAASILSLGLPTLVVLNMADDLRERGGDVSPARSLRDRWRSSGRRRSPRSGRPTRWRSRPRARCWTA